MLALNDGREPGHDYPGTTCVASWAGPKCWIMRALPSGRQLGARATTPTWAQALVALYDTAALSVAHAHDQGA